MTPRGTHAPPARERIAGAALGLFATQGYAQTTIDQIAVTAGVGRRTVFNHFETKEAILFDQLTLRQDLALQRLRERPADEPPLLSLHAILRAWCSEGYDRRLLAQIRAVLAAEPRLAGEQLTGGIKAFEANVHATLRSRPDAHASPAEIRALTRMACGWFLTAVQTYFVERRSSLLECFDEVVALCVSGARGLM